MKKYILMVPVILLLSFHVLVISANAQSKVLKQGFYKTEDLNLSKGFVHTIQNTSSSDYAFIAIFDSNQITRQYMRLDPQSEKYVLVPLESGYEVIISTKSNVTID